MCRVIPDHRPTLPICRWETSSSEWTTLPRSPYKSTFLKSFTFTCHCKNTRGRWFRRFVAFRGSVVRRWNVSVHSMARLCTLQRTVFWLLTPCPHPSQPFDIKIILMTFSREWNGIKKKTSTFFLKLFTLSNKIDSNLFLRWFWVFISNVYSDKKIKPSCTTYTIYMETHVKKII